MFYTHTFTGIGTHWQITVNSATEPQDLWRSIRDTVSDFESRFSRFKPDSLVNQFNGKKAGTYQVDDELALLLNFAQNLKQISNGKFDPSIGQLISHTGYDSDYSFKEDSKKVEEWKTPQWSITNNSLTIDSALSFDFGGFGKGYLIDKLSQIIKMNGFEYFLVDGGGDMYGTQKNDNDPWQLGIEDPYDNSRLICTIQIKNKSLAVSDIFKRRWQNRHHIIDPDNKTSPKQIISCSVIADNAMTADALTTCLMLNPKENWSHIASKFSANYQMITDDNQLIIDPNWPGQF